MANFEKIIKEKLENVDVQYNSNHWDEMNQLLDAKPSKLSGTAKGLIGTAAVIAGVAAGALLWNANSDTQTAMVSPTENNIATETNVDVTSNAIAEETIQNNKAVTASTVESKSMVVDEAPQENSILQKANTPIQDTETQNNNQPEEAKTSMKSGSTTTSWGKFNVSETNICQFGAVTFSLDGSEGVVSYLWNFGDGNTSNKPSPTHIYNKAGLYDVSLTLTNVLTGSDTTQTKANLITVKNAPEFDFDWELANAIDIETEVAFELTGIDANETFTVNLADGNSKSSDAAFTHRYAEAGKYNVSVTATNTDNGCTLTKNETVKVVNDYNLLAPTGFNPSSLIEANKAFIPVGLKTLKSNNTFVLEIFNPRKGMERVYRTNTYTPWNGKQNNVGEQLAPGVYNWQALITKPDGSQKKFIGSVTLLK